MIIDDNGVRLITLGDKDTYISQLVDETGNSQGILFSNKIPKRTND